MWDKIVKRPDHMSVWHALNLIIRWRLYRIGCTFRHWYILIMCHWLKWHRDLILREWYSSKKMIHDDAPMIRKYVTRHRKCYCKRCGRHEFVEENRRVHSDTSYPERRFA